MQHWNYTEAFQVKDIMVCVRIFLILIYDPALDEAFSVEWTYSQEDTSGNSPVETTLCPCGLKLEYLDHLNY